MSICDLDKLSGDAPAYHVVKQLREWRKHHVRLLHAVYLGAGNYGIGFVISVGTSGYVTCWVSCRIARPNHPPPAFCADSNIVISALCNGLISLQKIIFIDILDNAYILISNYSTYWSLLTMDTISTEIDCESVLQMMQEAPEVAAVIIDMIAELEEADETCIKKVRELQARNAVAA
jgi:hypothetical protein